MEIKTKRLTLTPLGPQYLEAVNEYALDYENTKFMMFLPNESSEETLEFLEGAAKEWANEDQYNFEFAIILNGSVKEEKSDDTETADISSEGKMVGGISITLEEDNRTIGELGWIVNKKYWQQGIASEAAAELVEYFKEHYGVNHFIAHCDGGNPGSYKTMEKIGMVKTAEYGGRKNKSSDEERVEYQYELICE